MQKQDWIILAIIEKNGRPDPELLFRKSGFSSGKINDSLNTLVSEGYLDKNHQLTEKVTKLLEQNKPKRAIILAAGPGLRMLPDQRPKGLLKINNETLIERIIRQLQSVDISEITVVSGYEKERFEYLSDQYGAELIFNEDFVTHDSLRSLRKAIETTSLKNCYIVPSNVWFERNPFSLTEYFSWYAMSSVIDDESIIRFNEKMELTRVDEEQSGNTMLGLCYLLEKDADAVEKNIREYDRLRRFSKSFWEEALFSGQHASAYGRVMLGQPYFMVKRHEHIAEINEETENQRAARNAFISRVFGDTEPEDITNVAVLNQGMTNRLIKFCRKGKSYLLRLPGEGSNELTNRREEASVYEALAGKEISDRVVYISPETGIKITEFLENSRNCDIHSESDVKLCMGLLRSFHELKLEVAHDFDIFEKIEYYETLRGPESLYQDYETVKARVLELRDLLKCLPSERCLCHVDSVCDNFLINPEGVFLIDWEYAGMGDPHMDIAMFCIYAIYDKAQIDRTIDLYFGEDPGDEIRLKIYCYVASAGFLWSLWCEYKQKNGVQYGEYALSQYRYAKKYSGYARELAKKLGIAGGSV